MSYRILTKNAVENTNIDGARDHNFNAGRRSGIVQGALNSGNLFLSANNTIALDTCELRLCGHRVVIDNAEYKTFYNQPSVPIRYSLVAQIIVSNNGESVSFDLKTQLSTIPLVQNDLDKNINGTYELEIGRFTQLTDGTLTDVVRTADLITGGGNNDSEYIRIGTVTTNKISPELDADVDIENTINPDDNKPQTNFTFNLPTSVGTVVSVNGEEKTSINTDITPIASSENLITSGGVHDYPAVTFAESERQKSKNLFDYTKIKSLNYGITQADGIFTINTQFYYPLIGYDIKLNQGETYTFSLNIDSYSNSDGSGVNSEIVLFDANGSTDTKGIGGVNSIGRYSVTFTPTFDVVKVQIRPIRKYNETSTLTGTVSNLMICVGEDRDYQPYNGQITHNGDAPVVFAESERQKSKNLFDYTKTYGYSACTSNGDGSYNINVSNFYYPEMRYKLETKIGQPYSFSAYINSFTSTSSVYFSARFVYTDGKGEETQVQALIGQRVSLTLTPAKDVDYIVFRPLRTNVAATTSGVVSDIQIEEGSIATDYQPYNGAIVHEKEIADVEHIETIYDKSSSDSNINKGYTSGLQFSETTGYSIMEQSQKNKYKCFRATAHLVNTDLIFEFMNNVDGYARGGFSCQAQWLDNSQICAGNISISPWGSIPLSNCIIQSGSTVTSKRDDTSYYISKIEGVLLCL